MGSDTFLQEGRSATPGVAVAQQRAKKMLMAAQPVRDQELPTEEIINRVLSLLARQEQVSLEEAWTLQGEITGSWI